jgi:hypothetical protein
VATARPRDALPKTGGRERSECSACRSSADFGTCGNYAYLFGLDHSTARRLATLHDGGLPYPIRHRCGEHPEMLPAA